MTQTNFLPWPWNWPINLFNLRVYLWWQCEHVPPPKREAYLHKVQGHHLDVVFCHFSANLDVLNLPFEKFKVDSSILPVSWTAPFGLKITLNAFGLSRGDHNAPYWINVWVGSEGRDGSWRWAWMCQGEKRKRTMCVSVDEWLAEFTAEDH